MAIKKLLIANRGEIAIRIARAASELGIETVAVCAEDDARSLHVRRADRVLQLAGKGPSAYLDAAQLIALGKEAGCDAVHPGYGFLSENFEFADQARRNGIVFVGPRAELLDMFGDKSKARKLARTCGVPCVPGSAGPVTLEEARRFFAKLDAGAAVIVKAVSGGGGRGMRIVRSIDALADAYQRCRSEALGAFGNSDVYVERLIEAGRHIEIQVVGDGNRVVHFGERECTIQRRHQKMIEVAPSPTLSVGLRRRLCDAAVRMASEVGYQGLGTFEFLVWNAREGDGEFAFIEVNPRLQVEHTVTEEVYGIDLVQMQLRIAGGATLAALGIDEGAQPRPEGIAIQLRVNMETIDGEGNTRSTGGTLDVFDLPAGPGIRVDTFGYTGYQTSPRYDSLLAKLIVHHRSDRYSDALLRARRSLSEFRVEGVATNIPLLGALLQHPAVQANELHTRFVEDNIAALLSSIVAVEAVPARDRGASSAKRSLDPLAVFGGEGGRPLSERILNLPAIQQAEVIVSPLQGTVVGIDVTEGQQVRAGEQVAVLEAMKMEHPVLASVSGKVMAVAVEVGDALFESMPLLYIQASADGEVIAETAAEVDLDAIRPDLAEVIERHDVLGDARRPDAVARRRKTGQRTARENIADLCDEGSFIEYGGLALASQRHRRSLDELLKISPADGLITGIGSVNGSLFAEDAARCAVLAYDYTVFAGTQGYTSHRKTDRLLALARKWAIPTVVFAEGGGGRPGDQWHAPVGLDSPTFSLAGSLSGLVPTVGIASGRCFAGNAALLGVCDVIIATRNANIGMGGPAMIEGGGLGVYRPEEVGPLDVQAPNGVVDIVVENEADGVAAAKKYLSYFQGRIGTYDVADQRLLRSAVPENRMRSYDIRALIATLADAGSVLELRSAFGPGMITAFIRIEGRALGVIANNSMHLGGAIAAEGADKAARFIQLCDGFNIPILSLCDTPGMMVGPEIEKAAQVRHTSRLFLAAQSITVPYFTVVLRKAYGLGAIAMAGGSAHSSFFFVAWPTGEFGAMGLEGAVKLAYRKEMADIEDAQERKRWYDTMVAKSYEQSRALHGATHLEFDDVIDPKDTRSWISRGLRAVGTVGAPAAKKRPLVDAW
ncbi:carboxyl transferase domain-containing protein [Bradyrhizobium sp. AS23.2]|uniref:carboxyl transferase domain-containing protein n=1 Tax=Bradyrhizobium sp. AS23.2 TaxID=1680155 RepID=UPI00093A4927|nr:carboxyl transferase domain-containing protein [Bradyrhizobium sp. AS23.2]OKO69299.1 carbamoyl-phosphate synthase large subunit [Bradyrhizobium sp. AS23.2]